MKIHDKPGLELIAEFQKIEINIVVLERSFINTLVEFFGERYSDDPEAFYREWEFEVKFNNDYVVNNLDFGKTRSEYNDYILKKVNEFYREIGDVIESDSSYSEKMIILNDYKTKFLLISDLFAEEVYHYCSFKFNLLTHNNLKLIKESDKNISEHNVKHIIHSFLIIQKQAIGNILFFLESKISLLREIGEYEFAAKKTSKSIKRLVPIKNLNRFQTGLLFNYLQNVGAINEFSANTLGPLISQLTGHSENTLRTEVLSNITDVKKGIIGDKTQIIKDQDINLKLVKE